MVTFAGLDSDRYLPTFDQFNLLYSSKYSAVSYQLLFWKFSVSYNFKIINIYKTKQNISSFI